MRLDFMYIVCRGTGTQPNSTPRIRTSVPVSTFKYVSSFREKLHKAWDVAKAHLATEDFKITRSIRQGCPMSALLFTLVSEALCLAIEMEKKYKRNIDKRRRNRT